MESTIAENRRLEDYNTIDLPEVQQPSARDLVMQSYRRRIIEESPKPTFDKSTPEYLKRAAKYNAIAKGLSGLASTISLAKGGNVNTPQPDNKTGAYVNSYFKYLDDYRDKVDKYDLNNFGNLLRLDELDLQNATRKEDIQMRWNEYNQRLAHDKEMEAIRQKYESEMYAAKTADEKAMIDQKYKNELKLIGARNSGDLAVAKERGTYYGQRTNTTSKAGFDGKGFGLWDDDGTQVASLQEGEKEKVLGLMMQDPEIIKLAENNLPLKMALLGKVGSIQEAENLIAEHWKSSPKVRQYIKYQQQAAPAQPGRPGYGVLRPGEQLPEQTQSQFTTEQEAVIEKLLEQNPDFTREEIIKELGY